MKAAITIIVIALSVSSAIAAESHSVRGYTRSDGTYVGPHRQTNPNSTARDNYTFPGNYNPNTGQYSK